MIKKGIDQMIQKWMLKGFILSLFVINSFSEAKSSERNFNESLFIEESLPKAEISLAVAKKMKYRSPKTKLERVRVVSIKQEILQSIKDYLKDLHTIQSANSSLIITPQYDAPEGKVTEFVVKNPEEYPIPLKLNFFENSFTKALFLMSSKAIEKNGLTKYEFQVLATRFQNTEMSHVGETIFIDISDKIRVNLSSAEYSTKVTPVSQESGLYLVEELSFPAPNLGKVKNVDSESKKKMSN